MLFWGIALKLISKIFTIRISSINIFVFHYASINYLHLFILWVTNVLVALLTKNTVIMISFRAIL